MITVGGGRGMERRREGWGHLVEETDRDRIEIEYKKLSQSRGYAGTKRASRYVALTTATKS